MVLACDRKHGWPCSSGRVAGRDLRHDLHPCDVGIGLGSHDSGVAIYIAELFHRAMFPLILFSGANAPTTVDRFPRGEAVHYRDQAIGLNVPADAIRV